MPTFVLRRLASGAVLLVVISFLAFVLLSLPDNDVGRQVLGATASPELVAAKNAELGLDRPVLTRYAGWLGSAVQGDLGRSWFTTEDVTRAIGNRLPVTLSLMLAVGTVTAVVSFALGIGAGLRRGALDRAVQVLAVAGYALPGFLVTLVLVLVFAVHLGWFPAVGYVPLGDSVGGWLSSITLPVVALSIGATAGLSQQVRSAVIETNRRDFVRTLRARGLPRRAVLRHVLRSASVPALTVLGMQVVGLLGGTVIVEQIFGLPGIGSMAVRYTTRGDIPVVMGLVMVTVVGVVLINLLVDVLIGWLNPKARTP